ncbi:YdcF family protein [Pseudonocardia oroxyli]|uniref:Protein SanA, affects membrane permeability for vancomycin n=1 Tax=Pseudonocardia oroxyli TaxID=366584 RepID=A0A1G7P668_PSEOR|nr:YdcF family protein [Pseudonocardia oroxyli]SDF81765.1 protein SanA, affects membrane permeability for vancomycin [Pseudonocardia oroxyli]
MLLPLVALAIAVLCCWAAARRVRREPRRLSNAYWLLAALVVTVGVLGVFSADTGNPLFALLFVAALFSPLFALVLGVFLVLNGVTMLRRERVSAGNSLSLLAGLGVLSLVAAALPVILSGPTWLKALWLLGSLVAVYLAFQFTAFLGYAWVYGLLTRRRSADWVVVLGSGLIGDRVTPLLASRVGTGIAEFFRRGARLLVLSGGQGADEQVAEGEAMARWAVEHGAPPTAVRAETASRTTRENLLFSRELVQGPGLIVTSNYHVLRAAMLARRLGVDAQAVGAPTAGYFWPSAVLREFVAILREHRAVHLVLLALTALPLPAVLVAVVG